ncbi:SusC/RagA family TonB-linked outer membrane protein [Sphingobacterium sp. lm-10]|uniref:SusC/RagA family TonB-linked outer membrane protein n=1 Tax=Sphingobacterium sp. lm-10 TaxID=2944904 RepID=UPI0020207F25|nr:SusC/RagA family TonB-linked outer membrane protein [Sphingobacterium sp. lm-10]MCL7988157.1 SusC/RagA family TonB-linked outer membrane protein [Sphingobacterium sp. lm-10]
MNNNYNRLLAFKLCVVIILTMITGAYAAGFAQKVSLSVNKANLEEVFNTISRQTNYRFLYNDDVIRSAEPVSINVKDAAVEDVLKKVLNSNLYTFKVIAETITINVKPGVTTPTPNRANLESWQGTVRGTVKGPNGLVLSGATIKILRTGLVRTADQDGNFQIAAAGNDVLEISFVGYQKATVRVENRQTIAVVLQELSAEIEAVNVISTGYQTLDRKHFTGATSRVSAEEAERFGVPDVSRMLEGQAAGVSVQNVSGTFGAAPKIRVRGATSITGDNKPLWVIDGVILDDLVNVSNEALSSGDPNTLLGSSVAGLNPDDIESFTVLKDAAATALYGAAAMNGVVVVTTKKGRNTEGAVNVNYSGNYSTYIKPNYRQFDIMNSAEQMSMLIDMENMGYFNHSGVSRANTTGVFGKMYNQMYDYNPTNDTFALRNDAPSRYAFLQRYANANTDWFDLLFQSRLIHDHSLSISGGTAKSQNYVSTSFMHDKGFTIGNEAKRFTANVRNNYNFNDKLRGELLFTGMIRDQMAPGTLTRASDPVYGSFSRDFDINPYSYALNTSRIITPYNEDGSLEYFTREYAPFNILNELDNNYMHLKQMDIKVQGGLRYDILPQLTYSVDGMYRYVNNENQHIMTEYSNAAQAYRANQDQTINGANRFLYADPDFPNTDRFVVLPNGGFFNTRNDNMISYYVRNNLEYNQQFGDHSVQGFATLEIRKNDRQNHNFTGPGMEFDNGNLVLGNSRFYKRLFESGGAPFGMWYAFDRQVGLAFRGAYNYKEKYSLNFTTRYDGSNRMGKSTTARWLPTWNLSGAWDIDRENFFNQDNGVVSSLRLRGTYGLTAVMGNASNAIAYFQNGLTYRPYEDEREGKITIAGLENSELTWEKMYESNFGTDIGLFDNRLDVHVDYYRRNMFDLIGAVRTSGIGGQFIKTANYSDMIGQGVDAEIGGFPIRKENFRWRTSLTYGYNKTEITRLDVNSNIWDLVRAEGGALLGGPHRGMYSLNFEKLSAERGYPMFTGPDGRPGQTYFWLQDTDTEFLEYHGPVDPVHMGGFYNRFEYKNFSLSFLMKFSFGNYVRLQPAYSAQYSDIYNVSKDLINRWLYKGDERLVVIPSIIDAYANNAELISETGSQNGASYTYNAYNYSTERVAKGDYIRLSQVTFGYALPRSVLNTLRMRTGAVNFVANNLFILYADKKLNGVDPEFYSTGGVALPVPRQLTLSVKLGF